MGGLFSSIMLFREFLVSIFFYNSVPVLCAQCISTWGVKIRCCNMVRRAGAVSAIVCDSAYATRLRLVNAQLSMIIPDGPAAPISLE